MADTVEMKEFHDSDHLRVEVEALNASKIRLGEEIIRMSNDWREDYVELNSLRTENENLRELLKRIVEWKDIYGDGITSGAGTFAKIIRDIRPTISLFSKENE